MRAFEEWVRSHHFLLCLISGLLLVGAAVALVRIPLEVSPSEATPSYLFVQASSASELSVLQTESLVTRAVEGAVRTVPGLLEFSTRTAGKNVSVSLTFRPGISLDLATVQVQESIQPLVSAGLVDSRSISVGRFNPESTPLIRLSLADRKGLLDLPSVIQNEIKPRIEALGQVSKVEFSGADPETLELRIPIGRVLGQGIEPARVRSRSRAEVIRDSLGSFLPAGAEHDLPWRSVRARLELSSLDEFSSQVLSSRSALRLRDLAPLESPALASRSATRVGGADAAFAEIYLRDRGSPFRLDSEVRNLVSEIQRTPGLKESLELKWVMNRVNDLSGALRDVASSLLQSVGITFFVIFAFLRNWKRTSLISATVPLTLLLTVALLYLAGFSLNIMTLSGLILGIGMVVDNVILVLDRVVELRQEGQDLWPAIARASAQSSPALMMATLTNAIVFFPVSFTDSSDSFMTLLKAFQAPILATLLASILLTLFVLPILSRMFPGALASTSTDSEDPRVMVFFRGLYRFRKVTALGVLLGLFFIAERVGSINQVDLEPPADPWVNLQLSFLPETPASEHRRLFDRVEGEILAARLTLGFESFSGSFIPGTGSAVFQLYPIAGTSVDTEIPELEKRIGEWVAKRPPMLGAQLSVGYGVSFGAFGITPSRRFAFEGPRMAGLLSSLKELQGKLQAVPGVARVQDENEVSGREVVLFVPQPEQIAGTGMTLQDLSGQVSAALFSAAVGPFQKDGKLLGIMVSIQPGVSGKVKRPWNLEDIRRLQVRNSQGRMFSLGALGAIRREYQLSQFSREKGKSRAHLVVEFKEGFNTPATNQALQQVNGIIRSHEFPPGYGPQASSAFENVGVMQKQMVFMIGLASLLIYLVLGAAFNSFLLPIVVLTAVPAAVLCGVFGLWILARDLDVMARLSLVILVGIGVNNAIILIDLIQELRGRGLSSSEAVIRACSLRLKPILMTTAIQVLGVIPVAVGNSKIMGIPYASLGVTIISGMLLSTGFTLAVIPWFYDLISSLEATIKDQLQHEDVPGKSPRSLAGGGDLIR